MRIACLLVLCACSSQRAPVVDGMPEVDTLIVDAAIDAPVDAPPPPPPPPRQLALAAIGQQNSVRVYVATTTSFRTILNKPDPTGFGTGITWTDYDKDGRDDIVSVFGRPNMPGENELLVLHNNGDTGLSDAGALLTGGVGLLEGYDIDTDGDGDVYMGLLGGPDMAFRSNGTQLPTTNSWIEPGNSAHEQGIASGDMTSDGRPEVVLARGPYGEAMSRGTLGAPSPTWTRAASGGLESSDVAMVDFDQDGRLDAAFSKYDFGSSVGSIEVVRWDGTQIVPLWSTTEFGGVLRLDWADIDADGDADLAICDGDSRLRVFARQGTTFVANGINQENARCTQLAWGDYDADGDPDLAVAGDGVTVFNNNAATFVSVFNDVTPTMQIDWGRCGVGTAACFAQAPSL